MGSALASKNALVTGGAKGLGLAITQTLAQAGARVLVLGRDASSLARCKAELAAQGHEMHSYICDLQDLAQIDQSVRAIASDFGGVDVLVNNAGIAEAAPSTQHNPAQWEAMMRVNAQAPAMLCAGFLPGMRERRYGRIVNIASIAGLQGARNIGAYAASKHALLGWARCLAIELAASGVTVNSLCPGYINTPIFDRALAASLSSFDHDVQRATQAILKSAGQKRLLEPQEVARWVLRLVCDEGSLQGEALRLCP